MYKILCVQFFRIAVSRGDEKSSVSTVQELIRIIRQLEIFGRRLSDINKNLKKEKLRQDGKTIDSIVKAKKGGRLKIASRFFIYCI
ncbi:hypothetical protein DHB64_17905 [Antarcticibacterium sp. W02-3]|uniref:hypothetical protein n=1 Tax=Antarcticibacterium sp. W02-3 TaxID=2183747 RepID=UPI0020431E49|nr:hypothetical protein [Antarcticibacterium sp. W02-3]MCM4161765.1 hypothetical protein [Antarcticibacterium sp. W02-3]